MKETITKNIEQLAIKLMRIMGIGVVVGVVPTVILFALKFLGIGVVAEWSWISTLTPLMMIPFSIALYCYSIYLAVVIIATIGKIMADPDGS